MKAYAIGTDSSDFLRSRKLLLAHGKLLTADFIESSSTDAPDTQAQVALADSGASEITYAALRGGRVIALIYPVSGGFLVRRGVHDPGPV